MKHIQYVLIILACQYGILLCTILVAVKCNDGIILSADSLSSPGGMIESRFAKRVFLLSKRTALCIVGGFENVYQLYEELKFKVDSHELIMQEELGTEAIAHYARILIYKKYQSAHVIIAGCEYNNMKCLQLHHQTQDFIPNNSHVLDKISKTIENDHYSLHEILPGGTHLKQNVVTAGTGSVMVACLLEDMISSQKNTDINVSSKPLINRISEIMNMAMKIDHKSGGFCQMWLLMNKNIDFCFPKEI
eukprot:gene10294-13839_t